MFSRHLLTCAAMATLTASLSTFVGCGKSVTRTDQDEVIDLSGKWNDTDSRLVSEEMIADSLSFPWVDQYQKANGRNPTVRLSRVTVRADGEVINTDIFLNDLRRAFIKSGRVDVVSSTTEADITRETIADQQQHASAATQKAPRQETGADYMISGAINVQNDQEGRKAVRFYSVDLFLTDVQTRKQVWAGNKKLKKFVEGGSFQ
jgi:PBP1b-binding outer membrane lipoprotein LpoB